MRAPVDDVDSIEARAQRRLGNVEQRDTLAGP